MALNRQELFEKLLEQVHFPEKGNPAFKGAAVQSVVVHKNSRRWEFHLILRRPLSLNLFKELYQAVRVGFKDIAEVDLQISSPTTEVDPKLVADYWEYVIQHGAVDSPMLRQACLETVPEVRDGRVTIVVENEIIKERLTQQSLSAIEAGYQQLGFPRFKIHPFVDQSASQAKIKELREKHEAADAALAAKAMAQIKKKNATHKQKAAVQPADGPAQLGRVINDKLDVVQMKDIQGGKNGR